MSFKRMISDWLDQKHYLETVVGQNAPISFGQWLATKCYVDIYGNVIHAKKGTRCQCGRVLWPLIYLVTGVQDSALYIDGMSKDDN